MIEAADEVRKLKNTSDVAECGVSVDGTWQRRGHSSLNGCVAVLSIDTGKVVDLEVMSKWCRNCNTSKSSEKNKIQNYYGIAIRSNIGNFEEMQRAVIAAFYHCCSGKSNPMHGQCPLGSESWCAYQRAHSAGKVFYDKNAGLPKNIINKIKPTYLQLCDQNLLKKCLHGRLRMQMRHSTDVCGT
ncbi:uncharacterized protein TNCV_1376741 [Trichonephila clavipes]|nr:uncharacterized protein TNCV_1376741 [Trichonephila clavipes]